MNVFFCKTDIDYCSIHKIYRSPISTDRFNLKVGLGNQTGLIYYDAKKEQLLDRIEGLVGDFIRAINSYLKANVTLK